MSNYPNGFAHGLTLRGLPVTPPHPGKVFWVNNSTVAAPRGLTGSNSHDGTYQRPFSSITKALTKCVAHRGDWIFVMPGYSETITAADSVLFNKAGVTCVGLGAGNKMPCIEFNHADATVGVSADNVSIYNMNFNSSITGVTVGVNIKANVNYCVVDSCRFDVDATTTDEFNHSVRLVDGNVGCRITNNQFHMGLGGAVAAIHLDADTDLTVIKGNYCTGDYSTACIVGDTTLSTNILIEDNLLVQGIAGNIGTEPGIELLTGTTGVIRRNDIVCNLATKAASIVADSCFLFENYYNEDAAGTGGLIGAVSADD